MTKLNDREYYEARLKAERQLAATTGDPAIAAVHLQLAEQYERLLSGHRVLTAEDGSDESPALSLVTMPAAPAANLAEPAA